MLKSLYKYTSFRPAFFSNLLVRGSQKFALNDPFEMTPGAKKEWQRMTQEMPILIMRFFHYLKRKIIC